MVKTVLGDADVKVDCGENSVAWGVSGAHQIREAFQCDRELGETER